MDWKRDNYYTTRAGEKVRLIYTDKPGDYPLVFLDERGLIMTCTADGKHGLSRSEKQGDITGPWVEPVKPLELWANVFEPGWGTIAFDSEKAARANVYKGVVRIAVHMREVQS